MDGAKTSELARSGRKLRHQLHVAISKGGLFDIGDCHVATQIEIMAMARRAAVRDRRAMLGLTA